MSQVTSLLLPLAELLFSLARLLLPLTAFFNMLTASQAVILSRISVEKKNRFPPTPQAAFERISTT